MYSSPPSNDGRSSFTSSSTLRPIITAKADAASGNTVEPSAPPKVLLLPITFPAYVAERPSSESTVARPFGVAFRSAKEEKRQRGGEGVGGVVR